MSKNKIKHRTLPTNNIVDRYISLFATKQDEVEGPSVRGYGWSKRVIPQDTVSSLDAIPLTVSLISAYKFSRSSSRVFDYAVSVAAAKMQEAHRINRDEAISNGDVAAKDAPRRISYQNQLALKYYDFSFDLNDYLDACAMVKDDKNRKAALRDLQKVAGATVSIKSDDGSINTSFSMLGDATKVSGSTEISVSIHTSMFSEMERLGKLRFKNLSKALTIESLQSRELWKFIQSRGPGLKSDGSSRLPKQFTMHDAMIFLDIRDTVAAKRAIRRALKHLGLDYSLVTKMGFYIWRNNADS